MERDQGKRTRGRPERPRGHSCSVEAALPAESTGNRRVLVRNPPPLDSVTACTLKSSTILVRTGGGGSECVAPDIAPKTSPPLQGLLDGIVQGKTGRIQVVAYPDSRRGAGRRVLQTYKNQSLWTIAASQQFVAAYSAALSFMRQARKQRSGEILALRPDVAAIVSATWGGILGPRRLGELLASSWCADSDGAWPHFIGAGQEARCLACQAPGIILPITP